MIDSQTLSDYRPVPIFDVLLRYRAWQGEKIGAPLVRLTR